MSAPTCQWCGAPAANVDRNGEHIGHHTSTDECLRAITRRLSALELAACPNTAPTQALAGDVPDAVRTAGAEVMQVATAVSTDYCAAPRGSQAERAALVRVAAAAIAVLANTKWDRT